MGRQSWILYSAQALGVFLIFSACSDQQANGIRTFDPSRGADASSLGGGAMSGGASGITAAGGKSASAASGSGGSTASASGSGGRGPRSEPDAPAPNETGRGADAGAGDADGGPSPISGDHSDRVEHVSPGAHCTGPITENPTLDALCPIALCGNGHVDSCMGPPSCDQFGRCHPTTLAEECDTKTSQTCAGMGFVQGQVTCTSTCYVDWSDCGACGTDPRIEDCARVDGMHFDQTGQTLALASNGEQAAIVWPSQGGLRFALVNDDLSLAPTDCFTDAGVNWSAYLAPLANGWMLASYADQVPSTQSIQITVLDAHGAVTAKPAPSISGAPVALVGRPDGGPLLLYTGQSKAPGDDPTAQYAMAALLGSSGQPLWTRRVTEFQNAEAVAATYTGGGFLWASRPMGTNPLLARLELDGTMTTTTPSLGAIDFSLQLVWTGSEARLFWDQSYISLDRMGHPLGAAHRWIDGNDASSPTPVQLGARTAVLLSAGHSDPLLGMPGTGGSGHRSLAVLDQNGVAQPPFAVFANGNQGTDMLRGLAPVKDRLLAAFVSFDQRFHHDYAVYLASIRP
jgi:hypothetical protein